MELSAVVVTFPAAESIVATYRAELDTAARWGVPAHVTVLFPFVPPSLLTGSELESVAALARETPRFAVRFDRTAWFDDRVLWLAPYEDSAFRTLTTQMAALFPAYPPYEGRIDEPTPHLTIADNAPLANMRAAEREVSMALPFEADATHLTVLRGRREPDSWSVLASFPFG